MELEFIKNIKIFLKTKCVSVEDLIVKKISKNTISLVVANQIKEIPYKTTNNTFNQQNNKHSF